MSADFQNPRASARGAVNAHPNAHILAQLTEIAKTDPEPWRRLQRQAEGVVDWLDCNEFTALLHPRFKYRIKPTTVNIGGVELEGPLREAPKADTKLWLLFDHTLMPDNPLLFSAGITAHIRWLNEGRLFASREARDKYQDALVKLANGETK